MSSTRPSWISPGLSAYGVPAGIVLMAAVLRLWDLALVGVTNESATQGLTALTALSLEGWTWPLAGPPTQGLRDSSFFVSMVALANLGWCHPYSGYVVVIALNIAAVYVLYRIALDLFGAQAAWVSALLFASSPWAVLSARVLSPASCQAVFSLWLIHASLRWHQENGQGRLRLIVFLGLVLPQIHMTGLYALPWVAGVLAAGHRQLSVRPILTGVLSGLGVWTPWLLFQHDKGWREVLNWVNVGWNSPVTPGRALLDAMRSFQSLLHGADLRYWFGQDTEVLSQSLPPWLSWAVWIAAAVLLGAFVMGVLWTVLNAESLSLYLLLAWLTLPVFGAFVFRYSAEPDDVLVVLPIPFLLIGIMAARLGDSARPWSRAALTAVVLALTVTHVMFLAGTARFVADGRMSGDGRFGLSHAQRREVIRSVLEDSEGHPAPLVGPYSGWYPAYEYVYWYERYAKNLPISPRGKSVRYWIDEEPPDIRLSASAWNNQKENEINRTLAEFSRTPPDWEIQKAWTVSMSHVYRIYLNPKPPLR